jgi:heavy metal sensor kinase
MLWYGALIAFCLMAYSLAVGTSYARHVEAEWNRSAHEDIELATRAIVPDQNGTVAWPSGFLRNQVLEEEAGGHWIEVWSASGKQLLAAGTMNPRLGGPPDPALVGQEPRTFQFPAGPFRVVSQRITTGRSNFVIRAAISEAPGRKEIRSLWQQLTLLSLAVLAFGAFGSYVLVRRSLGPLARLADHARRITAEHLHERLASDDAGSELNQLRDAFNETLARLESSFDQLRRFTADASHELRTPLTALRSVGEVSLRQARSNEDYREVIGMMLEEADRLSRLVDDLLTLARADARSRRAAESVDLSSIVHEVVDDLAVLAEERSQTLETEANAPVKVWGDRLALRQALMNLVDNAIKYAPDATRVRIAVGKSDDEAFVEVADEGPGIAASHRERIFERFYRIDAGGSAEKRGSGLGLSIAKGTAEDHGGWIELDTEEGGGSTFRLVLPLRS